MYNQSSVNERQYQGINRTICIGLGGTGKDVLMRVRRLIVDRYKDLNNLPVVSFVHIDTDKEATQAVSLRTGNIYQGVDLGFQDAEKVNATITATQVTELVEGLEQFHSNRHQSSPYGHIAPWFPPQLLHNIKAIDQGAKGIRPVGRLAFFHNYQKIKNTIEIAEQRTRGHEQELLRQLGLIVNPDLNIFVVGSLCGGTGSGIFLDMAYSLRNNYPGVQIISYLVISPELYGNTPIHKTKFGDTESTRGTWLTKLLKSRTNLTSQLQQDVDNYLSELLTPSTQYFCIANVRNWLDALQTELNIYRYNLEERFRELNSAKNLEELEKKWAQISRAIQDIEEEFNLIVFNTKNSRIQDEARRAIKDTETAIKHNFELAVVLEALEIVKVLQQHTQLKVSQLTNLYRIVDDLKNKYEKTQATLKQSDSDEMSGEEIFSNEDIDICYNTLLPQKEYHAQIVQITQKILEPVGSGQSLAAFLNQNHPNAEELKQEIDSVVDRLFGSRSADIVQSVIKRFTKKYQSSERAVRLGQIRREAQPLLPLNLTAPYFHNSSAKKSELIGFKDTDEPEVKQFHAVLTERLAILDNVLKPTQAEDTVLIVNECAAFPLRLIDNLHQLQNHYFQQRKRNTLLHNERSDFTDIIPPSVPEMHKLQDIFYPCLAFDLIQENQETQQLEFQYFDELRGVYFTAALNPAWKQALQELSNNSNMAAALQKLCDGAIADIEHQSAKWQGHYLPKLRQFVARVDNLPDDDINYLYRSIVVGSRATDDSSAKPGIINRFVAQIQEKVNVLPVQNSAPLAIAENQKVITGEVIGDSVVDSGDNRTKRRLELEQLKQDIEDGIVTQEEYEDERQEILNKYPLRR